MGRKVSAWRKHGRMGWAQSQHQCHNTYVSLPVQLIPAVLPAHFRTSSTTSSRPSPALSSALSVFHLVESSVQHLSTSSTFRPAPQHLSSRLPPRRVSRPAPHHLQQFRIYETVLPAIMRPSRTEQAFPNGGNYCGSGKAWHET